LTYIEALVDTPLCLVAFFAYVKGWSVRKPLELVIATSHIVGTLMFMVPELYNGLRHVPPAPNNVSFALVRTHTPALPVVVCPKVDTVRFPPPTGGRPEWLVRKLDF
jgi:hypothetical protein